MKYALCILSLFLLIGSLHAADEKEGPKPNTLTPDEIAEGWILLFDGTTNFGWKIEGDAKIEDGVLVLGGGDQETVAAPTSVFSEDVELRLHFESTATATTLPAFVVDFGQPGDKFTNAMSLPRSSSFKQGVIVLDYDAGNKTHVSSLSFDGGKSKSEGKATNVPRSSTSIGFKVPPKCQLRFHSLKLRPTGLRPIFNGKALTGWKEISGRKSKFSVTDDGELSIKDGPGDIQTEGQWDDFVVQLDIKTNGKHLNSGVFFRAIPGQFWSGYESQIRNQWQGDDRTKPVDFGTGGIYGRQPARKVVSSDSEWFTKTVIAHGNHMAVWVNGYQVSDFTDERPESDNARKGAKLGKGPISLQGHDPTTDLSFRNIRITDWPRKAD
jgi:hypothetical protein